VRGNRKENSAQIAVRDIESGEERELFRLPNFDRYTRIALSPDSRWLSFTNSGWGGVRSLENHAGRRWRCQRGVELWGSKEGDTEYQSHVGS